jgi:hypothetical protein
MTPKKENPMPANRIFQDHPPDDDDARRQPANPLAAILGELLSMQPVETAITYPGGLKLIVQMPPRRKKQGE